MSKLSADLIRRILRVPIAATQGNMLDGNIAKIPYDDKAVHLRTVAKGKPQHTVLELNGVRYKAVQVGDKVFVTYKKAIEKTYYFVEKTERVKFFSLLLGQSNSGGEKTLKTAKQFFVLFTPQKHSP